MVFLKMEHMHMMSPAKIFFVIEGLSPQFSEYRKKRYKHKILFDSLPILKTCNACKGSI